MYFNLQWDSVTNCGSSHMDKMGVGNLTESRVPYLRYEMVKDNYVLLDT